MKIIFYSLFIKVYIRKPIGRSIIYRIIIIFTQSRPKISLFPCAETRVSADTLQTYKLNLCGPTNQMGYSSFAHDECCLYSSGNWKDNHNKYDCRLVRPAMQRLWTNGKYLTYTEQITSLNLGWNLSKVSSVLLNVFWDSTVK
jgi:hypothetical protein